MSHLLWGPQTRWGFSILHSVDELMFYLQQPYKRVAIIELTVVIDTYKLRMQTLAKWWINDF